MYKWGLIICVLLFFPFVKNAKAQSISNEGTDFWAVFPSHVPSPDPVTKLDRLAEITIFVTSKYDTEVTVSCGTYSQKKSVPANVAVSFDVPRDLAYVNVSERNISLPDRGIHIKVTDGKPAVSAYAHIYAGQRSAASLILPYETLGQKYYSMNYTQSANGNNFLVLVAADDDVQLRIHKKNGAIVAVTLAKAGDVYEYISGTEDLTGIFVDVDPVLSPCKRFAAFSGSTMMELGGCANKSYDPLYQQLYTISSWGKNYGVVPFIGRKYILRVMAQEDNTTFTYNGNTQVIDKAGEYAELGPFTTSTFISADKLISVAEYSLTQSCSNANGGAIEGDPEMVMLNPIEFSIKKITVFSSELQAINHRYINVLIKENRAQSFKINGLKPAVTWQPLNGNTAYVYAQIEVTDRSLNLTADEGFNVIAYGFGNAESYAYSAGTNLSSNNYLSVVSLTGDRTEYPNACVGETVDFKIALPYEVNRIQWTLDGVLKDEIGLVPEARMVNGETVFVYTLMAGKQYLTAGHHEMDVETSIAANAASCVSGNISTVYSFDVYDLPTAKFEMAPSGCEKTELVFTDKSDSNTPDFPISEWLWDFGDGETSTEQNPKHTYAGVGTYRVRLSVKSGVVCASDPSLPQDIVIHPLPTAKFSTATSSTCINTNLTFTDESTIPINEAIVKWTWNFDGDIVERTDNLPFTHSFSSTGTKQVTLVATSSNGCLSVPETKSLVVLALPKAQFELPAFCLDDVMAKFNNKAVNSDGTTTSGLMTYLWNFGDPTSATNTSTVKEGQHRYTATGKYLVTLTVINENGCENTLAQEFTVNGAVKSAGFTVQNEDKLCSDKDVLINNTSEAYFGSITKIEIYKDLLNNPSDMQTITYPTAADIHLTYPSFGGNDPKPYTIRMIAYSGIGCNMTFDKVITLYPSPVLAFAPIPDVCENDGLVPLNQASEESGMIGGTSSYSGAFVSAGVFNAKAAKAGVHPITFTYTALNGCPASITRNITVYKSPEANAGETIYMLSGGYAKMHATASSGATYQWSPSDGLENPGLLNPSVFPAIDTKYTLTVSTDHCTTTSEVWVRVLQELKPSNAFSPNGDNINDTWEIKYLNTYPNAMVQIFNRYGQIVFTSHGYANPFDGNYQGNPLPVGTYYYIITPNNGRQKITGSLTLIR